MPVERSIRIVGHQGGVGMLEVLVALFVFGIGLLGATALSVQAYRLENRALIRARVVMLTADLAGRIQSNAAGIAAYEGSPADQGCSSDVTPARVCTPGELAADDLSWFHTLLDAVAPTARVSLSFDETLSPAIGSLSVEWSDGDAGQHYRMAFTL